MPNLKRLFLSVTFILPSISFAATGNDLMRWLPNYEAAHETTEAGLFMGYVSGVFDLGSSFFFCPPPGVTNGQNAAIVAKYLKSNPEKWNLDASQIVIEALRATYPQCQKTK